MRTAYGEARGNGGEGAPEEATEEWKRGKAPEEAGEWKRRRSRGGYGGTKEEGGDKIMERERGVTNGGDFPSNIVGPLYSCGMCGIFLSCP